MEDMSMDFLHRGPKKGNTSIDPLCNNELTLKLSDNCSFCHAEHGSKKVLYL